MQPTVRNCVDKTCLSFPPNLAQIQIPHTHVCIILVVIYVILIYYVNCHCCSSHKYTTTIVILYYKDKLSDYYRNYRYYC
jgi:hypothetical protein